MNWFKEMEYHLTNDKKPSDYFNQIIKNNELPKEEPYTILYKLQHIDQEKRHHPEGNVHNHTMEVIDLAAHFKQYSKDQRIFMWAAFLHDLGKITTTKLRKGRLTAYDHDKEGAVIARDFLDALTDDQPFIDAVIPLVRWHMQPLFVYKNMPYARVDQMVQEVSISEVGLLSLCDRLGRGEMPKAKKDEVIDVIQGFLKKCKEKVVDDNEIKRINQLVDFL